jgi:hypothetical protein
MWLWPDLMHYPDICLEGPEEETESPQSRIAGVLAEMRNRHLPVQIRRVTG